MPKHLSLLLLLLTLSLATTAAAQRNLILRHCPCLDKIAQDTPVLDGKLERYYSGKLVESGSFRQGKKDGAWMTRNRAGVVIRKLNYAGGELDGTAELFYFNGKPKLTANFSRGKKTGAWTYYNGKGKPLMQGSYEADKPVGTWTIFDNKGKKPQVQYDFAQGKYLVNEPPKLHGDNTVVRSDNATEYFILRYPARPEVTGSAPLGGWHFASDLFVDLVEVPQDYWDTYADYKYKATFRTDRENRTTVAIEPIAERMPDATPIFPFLIITNESFRLKNAEHSAFSKQLLDFKVLEALNFLPPWIYNGREETTVEVPYVINRIIGY